MSLKGGRRSGFKRGRLELLWRLGFLAVTAALLALSYVLVYGGSISTLWRYFLPSQTFLSVNVINPLVPGNPPPSGSNPPVTPNSSGGGGSPLVFLRTGPPPGAKAPGPKPGSSQSPATKPAQSRGTPGKPGAPASGVKASPNSAQPSGAAPSGGRPSSGASPSTLSTTPPPTRASATKSSPVPLSSTASKVQSSVKAGVNKASSAVKSAAQKAGSLLKAMFPAPKSSTSPNPTGTKPTRPPTESSVFRFSAPSIFEKSSR